MSDWMISPRDRDLGRSLDPVSRWSRLDLVERLDGPDTWTLTGPADVLDAFEPGMGCVLDRDGEQVTSGQMWSYSRVGGTDQSTGRPTETVTLGFIADTAELATRRAWQAPSRAIGTTLAGVGREFDERTGPREDLILAYVNANLGPGALADRQLGQFVLPPSRHRGGTTTVKARMNPLDELVFDLAEAAGLRVRIVHDESGGEGRLCLTIEDREDLSDEIVFGPPSTAASALVTSWKFTYESPKLTRALVAGGGEAAARLYAQRSEPGAEALWMRATEEAVEQQQAKDAADVDAAVAKAFEKVRVSSLSFDIADTADVRYRRDYGIGSRVGLLLPNLPQSLSTDVVREVTTTVAAGSGGSEATSVVVGSVGATGTNTKEAIDLTQAIHAIRTLERNR